MRAALISAFAAAVVFAGCRGGDSEDYVIENPPSVDSPIDSLKINPPNASVVIGGSQQFTVTPGDSKVIWKVDGQESSDTAIDTNNGELLIADDETAPTIIISASLEADSSKKATAAVTIMRLADCFSNAAGGLEGNSAIDVIQGTKLFGQPFVHILLTQDTETVDLGASDQDINGGLVLTATGDSPNSPAEVVIDGGGREITLSSTGTFPVITVETGVTLTLRNITLTGNNSNNAPLIKVDGGMLVLEDGAHITGNTNTAGNGGGVYVTGGTFDMNGGTISGNTASNTAADNYGGGVYVTGGTFNMTGGTISGNTSTSTSTNTDTAITVGSGGGGVYAAGGSTFEMTGGAISGNTASNTSTETGTETTSGSGGGGVYAAGGSTFEMTGGAISGNKATSTNDKITVSGGGVYFAGSACTMTNANITKNTANSLGGGVYFAGSACTMTNANITENTAGLNSGGVYVSSGTFKMDGGAIS
ncbi:MAG: hypothetical protein LBJ86_06070, partial [Spirochaetaceae bacterium]|nr:hypothetical protein [Spirochaetaceae bacterium]